MKDRRDRSESLLISAADSWLCLNTKSFLSLPKGRLSNELYNKDVGFIMVMNHDRTTYSIELTDMHYGA